MIYKTKVQTVREDGYFLGWELIVEIPTPDDASFIDEVASIAVVEAEDAFWLRMKDSTAAEAGCILLGVLVDFV